MIANNYDLIIIGAGPAGAFTAYEYNKLTKGKKKILLVDKGKAIQNRKCPIGVSIDKCIKCKQCAITTGFAGSGAFSDAKLSLYDPEQEEVLVGGNLPQLIGNKQTKQLIDYCDSIYMDFGADTYIAGVENKEEIKKIKDKSLKNDINLIDIPIRHLGTEKSRELYYKIQKYLIDNGVKILFNSEFKELLIDESRIVGVVIENSVYKSNNVVLAMGRNGSGHLSNICEKYGIERENGIVDIGIRYELNSEKGIKKINELMYEGKFVSKISDSVRTFCQNPDGFVTAESYDGELTLVNGHAFKEIKSKNTNLAILSSHMFTEPFKDTIQFGKQIAKTTNDLANGGIIVQRLGDLLNHKRTWEHQLKTNSVKPTLSVAVAGDLALAFPYRTLDNIINFILRLDKVIEGFANPDNLMYGPEIKFYSNKIKLDKNLMTNIEGLYAIGDGAGLTRGLMMASCSGIQVARNVFNNILR